MNSREQIVDIYIVTLAKILEKSKEDIMSGLDASFKDDFAMTSVEFFPLIAELEEALGFEIDYHDFLVNVHTINQGADYLHGIIDAT